MKIDQTKCSGTGVCRPYCPVQAIVARESSGKPVSEVVQEECVECGVCLRAGVCPTGAIYMPDLQWPRSVRAAFSNPTTSHRDTNIGGRGTEEMKTNDVTGRFREGFAGVLVEMGRPGVSTTFREIEKVSMALAKHGIEFEPQNPVTTLIVDKRTGRINEEVLDEKVLSAIIGFIIENDRLKEALKTLREVSTQIDTVFSLGIISRVREDGSTPAESIARECGFSLLPSAKTNVGLGRPLKEGI